MYELNFIQRLIFRLKLLLLFGAVTLGLVVPPTVSVLNLLSSFNDTLNIYAQSPGSYAPSYTICTSKSLVRTGNYSLSIQEAEYVKERRKQAKESFIELMNRLNFTNVTETFSEKMITIAIAVSGGGYRSMLSGAGVLSALDANTPGSTQHLGGILQSSTYIAGNSGGSWLVANNLLNDGIPIHDAIRKQSFSSALIEGFPDIPISQLRAKLDAQSSVTSNGTIWPSHPLLTSETDSDKFSLAERILGAFFKQKKADTYFSNFTRSMGRTSLEFYKDLNIEVRSKKQAGFLISLIDYWGRAVSKKIFPSGKKSVDICMSSVTELSSFKNFSQLFPIFGSVERLPGMTETSVDSHLFEFNPFEFGSWDSNVDSFVDIKFLGTKLIGGKSTMKTKNEDYSVCVSGYDNLGLITGTSSGLFNTVFQYVYKMMVQMEKSSSSLLSMLLTVFGISSNSKPDPFLHPEYAVYSPNPFRGVHPKVSRGRLVSDANTLFLADGGDDGQNIPFHPLLVKKRKVEVIFAFDATSDYENFPNGTTLVQTASRYHSYDSSLRIPVFTHESKVRRIFPKIPSSETFLRDNVNSQPIFLGCDISHYPLVDMKLAAKARSDGAPIDKQENTTQYFQNSFLNKFETKFDIWEDYQPPLIIYFANHNHMYASNTSTFRTIYNESEVTSMLENGYNVATHNNDTEYIHCVGCAMLKRRFDWAIKSQALPEECDACFKKFCYIGSD